MCAFGGKSAAKAGIREIPRVHCIERWKTWQYLRGSAVSPGIAAKMKNKSGHTDTRTIQNVCMLSNCQPGDIMEYIPDIQN